MSQWSIGNKPKGEFCQEEKCRTMALFTDGSKMYCQEHARKRKVFMLRKELFSHGNGLLSSVQEENPDFTL